MSYRLNDDQVTLTMSTEDYSRLLLMLGYACGKLVVHGFTASKDKLTFWNWVEFVNRLNEGNSQFTPYEIPANPERAPFLKQQS